MKYYVVKYHGPFGFIKPWSAVRDSITFSQQFLTPSIIEGIEKKLFPELLDESGVINKIRRHKLAYSAMSEQQEQTQTRGFNKGRRNISVLTRGVLLNPCLYLAFANYNDAEQASHQHLCLCRNEDVLLPEIGIDIMDDEEFSTLEGFELRFGERDDAFLVGYNRFDENKPMYGWLECNGKSFL